MSQKQNIAEDLLIPHSWSDANRTLFPTNKGLVFTDIHMYTQEVGYRIEYMYFSKSFYESTTILNHILAHYLNLAASSTATYISMLALPPVLIMPSQSLIATRKNLYEIRNEINQMQFCILLISTSREAEAERLEVISVWDT